MNFTRIDTSLLNPTFCSMLQQLDLPDFYTISGYRSFDEQDKLYAQGRTAPGNIVTKAKGGQSAHNYGLAVDLCHDLDPKAPGLQPDWLNAHYEVAGNAAKNAGLESGFFWKFKDPGHIELKLSYHWDSMIVLAEHGKNIQAVWDAIAAGTLT